MKYKKLTLLLFLLILSLPFLYSSVGDTIVIQTFDYTSPAGKAGDGTQRDTTIQFPNNPAETYGKILMAYNIRCRGGAVNRTGGNDVACGEWDYNCQTYLHDSSRVDSIISFTRTYSINDFTGDVFPYKNTPTYDYYQFTQKQTVTTSITSEDTAKIEKGTLSLPNVISTNKVSGKAYYLYTAGELSTAGLVSGNVDAIGLTIASGNTTASFLKIRMKNTGLSKLSNALSTDFTGLTEVYYLNTPLSVGKHKFQFYTPFSWNGTDNILVEISSTNSTPSTPLMIQGHTTTDTFGLYNNSSTYLSFAQESIDLPTAKFKDLSKEITVAFWSYGDDILPKSTSIIEGLDANGKRTINIHLPWENGHIYWDCGNDATGNDRLEKLANKTDYAGKWNYWAFTKNTQTGNMNIYLNGTLWTSATGKTKPIMDIKKLKLGSIVSNKNFYYGKVANFSIFKAELTLSQIKDWMNQPFSNNLPKYDSLVAYYPLSEGTGNTINDLSLPLASATFSGNSAWGYDRGENISKQFVKDKKRPNMSFFQGNYTLNTTDRIIMDSLKILPKIVKKQSIISRSGTFKNDSINVVSTQTLWHAVASKVYDDKGTLLRSIPVTSDGSISIGDLVYYRRRPMSFQLMSFVTPYGIGLDLGSKGKTWFFDVTDFSPVLKGRKRFTVGGGGQFQEEMDIKFLFIKGTPPRKVLNISQIWAPISSPYAGILSNKVFEPRDVPLLANGKYFKLLSTITGHGQEGEFIPRNHYFTLNGGTSRYTWQVWKECAENPIYPQGGTWIYDRAGWCPGMPSNTASYDITSKVTPGTTVKIDYGVETASGHSDYVVSNQLVTYGAINHQLDAAVVEVTQPTDRVEYFRNNSICAQPKVIIQNTGSTKLTKLTIEYWINDNTSRETYEWNGSLDFLEKKEVTLPSPASLWNGATSSENRFNIEIKQPNDSKDEYVQNNKYVTKFKIPDVLPADFFMEMRTNAAALETKYELFDASNNKRLFIRENMSNSTTYRDTFKLGLGCYYFKLTDSDDDGMSFFANQDGTGSARLRRITRPTLHAFESNFGKSIRYDFTVEFPLSYEDIHGISSFKIYPNPTDSELFIAAEDIEGASITVFDVLGKKIHVPSRVTKDRITFFVSDLVSGIYFLNITYKGSNQVKKIVVR